VWTAVCKQQYVNVNSSDDDGGKLPGQIERSTFYGQKLNIWRAMT